MYRLEYPRPQFEREKWLCLNGEWDFTMGEKKKKEKIIVPFVYQCEMSGINDKSIYENVTYEREFSVPSKWHNKKIILNFGAVDYICKVYINNEFCGTHEGGSCSFSFDITSKLNWEKEKIRVEVYDPLEDETIPRGKQYWLEKADSIWYTQTTGIWQSVWIEPLEESSIENIRFTPDIDNGNIEIEYSVVGSLNELDMDIEICFDNKRVYFGSHKIFEINNKMSINLFNQKIFRTMNHHGGWCWSPENPNLFDVNVSLRRADCLLDQVKTYFGMRKIERKNGIVFLNNRPYYQKLILDQGYWKNSLLTAPSDDAFKIDILKSKEMGFNGCRKHQKAEDPRFLYWADKLGFLVWGEIPSAPSFSNKYVERITKEWFEIINRDYSHPSIVAWVTLNESWGVPNISNMSNEINHSLALYYTIKSLDSTRLVVGNDGWEMTKTDICAIHNYEHGSKDEVTKQLDFKKSLLNVENIMSYMPAKRKIYVDGFSYCGEPIILSEFGGVAFNKNKESGWGYTFINNENEFIETYERLIDSIYNSEVINGFCYTQLCDVEQEMNGLLTFEREFKCNPSEIKRINDKRNVIETLKFK